MDHLSIRIPQINLASQLIFPQLWNLAMPSLMYTSCAFALLCAAAESFSLAPTRKHVSNARPSSGATSIKVVTESTEFLLAAAPGISALALVAGNKPAPDTSRKSSTATPTLALARANFKRWNDALQAKDAAVVANMYDSSDLSFLPTVSPKHIKDDFSTEDYFTAFVQKNPFGTITDDSIQAYNDGTYLHSGLYTFELGEADARTPVQARFSYVWKYFGDGDWKISHHHSSVVPSSPPSATDMLATARENFKRWNDALQTKNAATVAELYISNNLSFLPTVSGDHIKSGGSGTNTEDYFTAFVQKNPFGTITDDSIQVYNEYTYLHSGMYTFQLGEADARTPVEARFSYVWEKIGNDWKIAHHHSSVRPGETPAPAPKASARKNKKSRK